MNKDRIIKAIAITQAICSGGEIEITDETVLRGYLHHLSAFEERDVLAALERCQREHKGSLALADIIKRIDDGRPDPEEAWAMCPLSEGQSAVWTRETAEAFGAVLSTLHEQGPIPARKAFLEAYRRLVIDSRKNGQSVQWEYSPGSDPNDRQRALSEACRKRRLTEQQIRQMDPSIELHGSEQYRAIGSGNDVKRLPEHQPKPATQDEIQQMINSLKNGAWRFDFGN